MINFLKEKKGKYGMLIRIVGDRLASPAYCTFDGLPVLVHHGVQGVRVAGAHSAQEAGRDRGERLVRHRHVALSDMQRLHQESGRHLQVLQGHLPHRGS